MANQGIPQSARSIITWVLIIGIAAFILLILVIIFGNLSGNTGISQNSLAFINDSINLTADGNIPANADDRTNAVLSGVIIRNASEATIIAAPNYTIVGVTISSADALYNNSNVNVSYTVSFDGEAQIGAENIILNYTQSAVNTSSQFPTVGTIIGIAFLLLILIGLLVFVIRRMMGVTGATGTGGGSGGGGSSKKFSGSNQEFG